MTEIARYMVLTCGSFHGPVVLFAFFGDIHSFNVEPAPSSDIKEPEVLARLARGRSFSSFSSSERLESSSGGVGDRRRLRRTARGPAPSASRSIKPFHQHTEKSLERGSRNGATFMTHLWWATLMEDTDQIQVAVERQVS